MSAIIDPNNRLFELARSSRRLPRFFGAISMASVFVIGGQIIGVIPLLLLYGINIFPYDLPPLQTALQEAFILVCLFVPILLLLWIWLAVIEKRHFRTLGFERIGAIRKYLRGVLIGVGMFTAVVLIMSVLGFTDSESGDPGMQGIPAIGSVLLIYIGWTVQGPVEEIVMRGWLLPVIGARYRPWLGIFISSLVFSSLHIMNPSINILAIFNIILVGVVFALIALWEGGLWGVCGLHAAWNWAQGNLFGFEVSGLMPAAGTLINLKENGPDILTGGSFGPEAGLITTILFLTACTILLILLKQKSEQEANNLLDQNSAGTM
ncbi:MAG: CPBP family intramembrane metalloprotease [Anaerolineaceae bacterium]|nr:CPBP family intramembrane metalloprotease [Anaerolineaceae bacterium]